MSTSYLVCFVYPEGDHGPAYSCANMYFPLSDCNSDQAAIAHRRSAQWLSLVAAPTKCRLCVRRGYPALGYDSFRFELDLPIVSVHRRRLFSGDAHKYQKIC